MSYFIGYGSAFGRGRVAGLHTYVVAFVIGLAACYILTPPVSRLAARLGAIDRPDHRKVHKAPVPRMGGLAIYAGFVAAIFASVHLSHEIAGLLLGGTLIVIIGVIDDICQLPAKLKLLGQVAAAGVLVLFGVKIEWLTYPGTGGYLYMDHFSVPVTILWVVSMTNALNLIDGLDGLAAGVSMIASLTVCLVAVQNGLYPVAVMTAALAGATFAFIKYNFNPASIFMGDTGSMFLGYMLAAISVFGVVKSAAAIALLTPAVALGLPIIDTCCAILRRYSNGKPIFQPDKGHLHHRLLAAGLSQKQAVFLMYLISAALSASAVFFTGYVNWAGLAVIGLVIAAVFVGAKKMGILNDI
jgi:UDP-GlcNAc:undecaprenyl-phosphate GlcNAc-1-phosphate transferase